MKAILTFVLAALFLVHSTASAPVIYQPATIVKRGAEEFYSKVYKNSRDLFDFSRRSVASANGKYGENHGANAEKGLKREVVSSGKYSESYSSQAEEEEEADALKREVISGGKYGGNSAEEFNVRKRTVSSIKYSEGYSAAEDDSEPSGK